MARKLQINSDYVIGDGNPVFVIAEIGQNHQGSVEIAKKLILAAKDCGADCVKFQKSYLPEKFNKLALSRVYKGENSWGGTYGEHKKFLEFSEDEFRELQSFAEEVGILFTASAMDYVSLNFLASIHVPFIKIGSGDANNFLILEKAARMNIPLIISTGMQNFATVKNIYELVGKFHKNFAVLHCVSAYPAPFHSLNLRVIDQYKSTFSDVPIGYSGHELGIHVTLAAVAAGAQIIERHFTLDKNQKGSDHKCSLEPEELKTLVRNVRDVEVALGGHCKTFQECERGCFEKLGKSIVAARFVAKGEFLKIEDLKIKVAEPKGINAELIYEIVGRKARRDVGEDEAVTENCIF